ncbi:DJ-1/PfpI family protein [Reinekea marinisedimentorum]|uniref:DJ-1/PfpI family protein n=1 Tax=Reinekea marinisedimentorum TaxID=230495 RepID=A0A4R3I4Z2_9GAMM|nr:DJ-1/PfpI family protein [Reinekea marinisedimentorum]TCS40701.1 DJ-1/PfpI family protein [Reinekea marinisedimentorum]
MNVAIFVYDNAEVMDFSGPFEVFTTAKRLSKENAIEDVFLIAEHDRPVIARGDYLVQPHYSFESHPDIDVLVVVGGVHNDEMDKPAVTAWIDSVSESATVVSSVCSGAFLLAAAGLLDGLEVTTHWDDQKELAEQFPAVKVLPDRRWVDQGHIVTSGGITAGIDMSLHLVARLVSQELADITAHQMEFNWARQAG